MARSWRVSPMWNLASTGLHEHQHVDIVVDMLADGPVRIQANEICIEVATVRKAPDRPTATDLCGTEIDDQRPFRWAAEIVSVLAVVEEVCPAGGVAAEVAHHALSVRPASGLA